MMYVRSIACGLAKNAPTPYYPGSRVNMWLYLYSGNIRSTETLKLSTSGNQLRDVNTEWERGAACWCRLLVPQPSLRVCMNIISNTCHHRISYIDIAYT